MSSTEVQTPKLYDDIMLIKGGNAAGEYQLRVLRKWTVSNSVFPGNVESVDMVLIDRNVSFYVDYCSLQSIVFLSIDLFEWKVMKNV
ncbi:hypothetical protein L195_g057777 [Trifolium pratense]|uniref:Uncharacterized protein n=1 Tax=Trifolium pratense TaxID=57577 RepID=A0A2K3KX05_TRIPR|nr:hypothetical protein L195_g057777 [Trifolium pratense]